MYWLVMAAASLASLSEWLWEGKNQGQKKKKGKKNYFWEHELQEV